LDAPQPAAAQAQATTITSISDVEHARSRHYFFSTGLSELAPLFSAVEEPLLFDVSVLLSDEDAEADPLPLDGFPLEEDFFA